MSFTAETAPESPATVEQLVAADKPIKPRKKRESKHDFKDGSGRVPARRHVNGKGWVAKTAIVEDSVYVGPRAQVYDAAYVTGNVRLEGQSKISGQATVTGSVILKNNAHVFGRAVVRDQTLLCDNARVTGTAHVTGASRLYGNPVVTDSAQIVSTTLRESVVVGNFALMIRSTAAGNGRIRNNAIVINSIVEGNVIVEGFAQVLGGAHLRNWHSNHSIHLTENAIVADRSALWYPVVFRGHATAINCTLTYNGSGLPETPIVVDRQIVLYHRRFSMVQQFIDVIAEMRQQPVGSLYANSRPAAQSASSPRTNYLEAAPTTRRVQRLEAATV